MVNSNMGEEMRGIVKWFDVRKGYGFITGEDGKDYFTHYSVIQDDGFKKLEEDDEVIFTIGEGREGRLQVSSVTKVPRT